MRARRDDIERIAVEILDDAAPASASGEFDFVERIAAPFPLAVIAWVLGVPADDWDAAVPLDQRGDRQGRSRVPAPRRDRRARRSSAPAASCTPTSAQLIDERRRDPRDDLVSELIRGEIDGAPLTEEQLVSYCELLVEAGNETTRNAISGGLLAFSEHRGEWEKLREQPELLPDAVEEILRWVSPISHFTRTATEDYEVRGATIRAGEQVALYFASANRDEEVFDEPVRVPRRPPPEPASRVRLRRALLHGRARRASRARDDLPSPARARRVVRGRRDRSSA